MSLSLLIEPDPLSVPCCVATLLSPFSHSQSYNTTPDVECTDTVLPVTYPKFAGMMEPGDTLYVGRYLVSGADSASLYLEVSRVM